MKWFWLLLLAGCTTTSKTPMVKTSVAKPVKMLAPTGPKEFVLQWRYPTNVSGYTWSLESSVDLKTWVTVTNYPYGYTNDVWATNDWSTFKAFRMHGRL